MQSNKLQIKTVIDHLRDKIPHLIAVYIFGSWGSEYERLESDIDIAVLADRPLNVLKTFLLHRNLQKS